MKEIARELAIVLLLTALLATVAYFFTTYLPTRDARRVQFIDQQLSKCLGDGLPEYHCYGLTHGWEKAFDHYQRR